MPITVAPEIVCAQTALNRGGPALFPVGSAPFGDGPSALTDPAQLDALPFDWQTSSSYDAAGRVLTSTDRHGLVTKTYTLGHDVLAQATAQQVLYLLTDGHGSTRAVYDLAALLQNPHNPAAAILQRFAYDAYGSLLAGAGLTADLSAALTTYLYSGEQTDRTALQYLRARYYDPSSGRFTRLDPFFGNLEDPLSLNKYAYVHGDPISGVDPTGLYASWIDGVIDYGGAFLGGFNRGGVSEFLTNVAQQGQFAFSFVPVIGSINDAYWEYVDGNTTGALLALFDVGSIKHIAGKVFARAAKVRALSISGKSFVIHPRVIPQLTHPRLGSIAGTITPNRLHELVNNTAARRFFDIRTGNINVIQELHGRLLRITVARDEFKIISVGPIKSRNLENLIHSMGFVQLP